MEDVSGEAQQNAGGQKQWLLNINNSEMLCIRLGAREPLHLSLSTAVSKQETFSVPFFILGCWDRGNFSFFFFSSPFLGKQEKKNAYTCKKMNHLFLQDRALAQLTKKTALLKSPLVNQLVDQGCFQGDGYLKDSDITLRCTPS